MTTMSYISLDTARSAPFRPVIDAKRLFDIVLTLLILAVLWPVLLGVALAVGLSSRGSVFFVQKRVGLGGATFGMIKFRSMYQDAEARRAEMLALSDREGICLKLKNDPRITPVGRILRRWSLDELPQLFNVLLGDMSLVGPRPALPEEVAAYPGRAHARHHVLPGITGFWQVSGRADLSFDQMIDLDLAYVRQVSVLTDLGVMLRTVRVVLNGQGAY